MNRQSPESNQRTGASTVSPDPGTHRPVRRRRRLAAVDYTTATPPSPLLPLLSPTKRARISTSTSRQPSSTTSRSSAAVAVASAIPIHPMPNSGNQKQQQPPPPPPPWHMNDSSLVDLEEVDLTEPNADDRLLAREQEELLKLQRPDGQEKPKLADFKCVICLDDPTDLAGTPCGHMFCDFCLQGALRAGQAPNAKSGPCPVCRRKVNIREIVRLEMKLLTKSAEKGKGRAG